MNVLSPKSQTRTPKHKEGKHSSQALLNETFEIGDPKETSGDFDDPTTLW